MNSLAAKLINRNSHEKNYSIVVSDIHGDLNQLLQPLMLFLTDTNKYQLYLLGDYIDRGESNVYIYEIIKAIHQHPRVHALFGNHELACGGTIDYFSYNSPQRRNGVSYVKSFTCDLFENMILDIVNYDASANILYSHSPLNRPLEVVLKLPPTADSVFTYDLDSPNMGYKNIHGHDHKCSSEEEIKKFFFGSEVNMISIDQDASYGFMIMMNAMTVTNRNWLENAKSNVFYLIVGGKERYKIIRDSINYGAKEDYNIKPFEDIKLELVKASAKDNFLRESFSKMNLRNSYGIFRSRWNNICDIPRLLKDLYENNRRLHSDTNETNIYYHDIPFEYYQFAAEESNNSCPELKEIVKRGFIPVHELYWKYVIKDTSYGKGTNNKENFNQIVNDIITKDSFENRFEVERERYKNTLIGGDKEIIDKKEEFTNMKDIDYMIKIVILVLIVIVIIYIIYVISNGNINGPENRNKDGI